MTSTVVDPGREPYPVRLEGRLDPQTSRWVWLFKWLLAIPHVVVLFFLWIAALVVTVVAGFAILFTRRYPDGMFDFVVGVLRWTWRVSFYTSGAFGTDRYPPFTLASVPDYPADLHVDRPGELSRGLVLVKWWLLAIPHYLIIGVFAGGVGSGWHATAAGVSLISLLTFIAAVVLLFTGRYPRSLFDFVMGLNRWCFRVYGYVLLMTDRYPPFRLDAGGDDPGSAAGPPAVPTPDTGAHQAPVSEPV